MATYTVTKVTTRPNTTTQWPYEVYGDGYVNLTSKITSKTHSFSDDNLRQTSVIVWNTKADYKHNLRTNIATTRDDTLTAVTNEYNTYMAANSISATITEEDGTVMVFNSSTKIFDAE